MIKVPFLLLCLFLAAVVSAQEASFQEIPFDTEQQSAESSEESKPAAETDLQTRKAIKLRDFESIIIGTLRKEFPRIPGIFTYISSCRLPEYGPVISVTLQPPSFYFTRPILLELERRQKAAEAQAQKIRNQFDKAAMVVKLKGQEAEILERLSLENSSKKKNRAVVRTLENQLDQVRTELKAIEDDGIIETELNVSGEQLNDVDLRKMIEANYQQLVQKVTFVMKNILAENGSLIEDIKESDRVVITTYIRDTFLGTQPRKTVFVLNPEDIRAYRSGELNLADLKGRVLVKHQKD